MTHHAIQIRKSQMNHGVLDAIVAEIVLFDKQQQMSMTWDMFIEERELSQAEKDEQEELQKWLDREEARDWERVN